MLSDRHADLCHEVRRKPNGAWARFSTFLEEALVRRTLLPADLPDRLPRVIRIHRSLERRSAVVGPRQPRAAPP